jgi:hypothetical protein
MTLEKGNLLGVIITGMSLGTAWAIRGQFGHEQGAAWAGAIGALTVILLAKKPEWFSKSFKAALAAAVGWGTGGMMSYGLIVGYGRGTDFLNVYYGLLMLFVVGGLYGFMGGGLFGLSLAESNKNPVKWHLLMTEMTAGALITYYFLVEQLGWLMTPPRSELWAACLGIAFALTWYMFRNRQYSALKVAVYSGLGAGFGFAFGNFLQVMGNAAELQFNFWNVMEYSLGFFGGCGMAYGTFTSKWEKSEIGINKNSIIFPLLFLILIIPFIVWDQSFETERLQQTFESLMSNNVFQVTRIAQGITLASVLILGGLFVKKFYGSYQDKYLSYNFRNIYFFYIGYFSLYTFFSLLITGAFWSVYRVEQYLYFINLAIVFYLISKINTDLIEKELNYL